MKQNASWKKALALSAGGIALGTGVWTYWENRHPDITRYRILSARLPEEFDGMKIVQISDLHQFHLGTNQSRLIDAVKKEKPDLIAITGDLFDPDHDGENAFDLLRGIRDLAPVYYVLGNHEARINNLPDFLKKAEEYGVILLRNRSVSLSKGNSVLRIAGIDDPAFRKSKKSPESGRVKEFLKKIRDDSGKDFYTVLLSHRPEHFELYCEEKIDLVLSGHTHGGQFRLPFIGALYVPYQGILPKYANGPFQKGRTTEIISRGLGCSHIPFRFNNPPELCVITLVHE